jgi:thioredoxin 2
VPPSEIVPCPTCGRKNRVPSVARGFPQCGSCHSSLPWIVDATDSDFGLVVGTASDVLVDFWAPWCGPCRLVAPGVARAATELAGRIKAVKVNIDDAPMTAARFGVQSIPTLLLVRRGRVLSRQVGAVSSDRLIGWVHESLETATA